MAMIEAGQDVLILKRASASRSSGEWSDDDYDVVADGVVVGRIFKANPAPVGSPWLWTLAFGHHEDRTPTHGYADRVSRERLAILRAGASAYLGGACCVATRGAHNWKGWRYASDRSRAGVRLMRRRRGARASSASIAANSFSMARADGAPSVSFR
jgi:hypothetical protein